MLDPIGSETGSLLTEEFPGPLGHRQQAYHAFFLPDDTAAPDFEVDTHWLGETTHDVEGQVESSDHYFGESILVLLFLFVDLFGSLGTLQRPKKQRGQAGVSSNAVASPLRAIASAVPSTCCSAARPTISQTFSRYSGRPTSRPSAVSTVR